MRLFYFTVLLLLVTPLYAQQKVRVEVCDMQGIRLAYPELSIGNYFHRMGSEQGTLEFAPQSVRLNDTLTVKYLGYKPAKVLLDAHRLADSLLKVNLEEESYLLDSVTIVSNQFSSEEYFRRRMKKSLRPYLRKHFFDLDFTYQDTPPIEKYIGQTLGRLRYLRVRIDSTHLVVSKRDSVAKLLSMLRQTTGISYLTADLMCSKRERRHFHCSYKGETDGLGVWEFSLKREKRMPLELKTGDELRCIVFLDESGLIRRIKTQFTPILNDSASYLLDAEFILFKGKLVPLKVNMELVPSGYSALHPFSLVIDYSNHRKSQ